MIRPSGLTAQAEMPASADKFATTVPVSSSHTFSVLSHERGHRAPPVRRHRHRDGPESEWPFSVRSSRPLSSSHTFSVLSQDAETARRPSAVTATPLTESAVALQRAQLAAAFQLPHLQRVVPRRRHRAPPVGRHRHAVDRIVQCPSSVRSSRRFPGPTPSACGPTSPIPREVIMTASGGVSGQSFPAPPVRRWTSREGRLPRPPAIEAGRELLAAPPSRCGRNRMKARSKNRTEERRRAVRTSRNGARLSRRRSCGRRADVGTARLSPSSRCPFSRESHRNPLLQESPARLASSWTSNESC